MFQDSDTRIGVSAQTGAHPDSRKVEKQSLRFEPHNGLRP